MTSFEGIMHLNYITGEKRKSVKWLTIVALDMEHFMFELHQTA